MTAEMWVWSAVMALVMIVAVHFLGRRLLNRRQAVDDRAQTIATYAFLYVFFFYMWVRIYDPTIDDMVSPFVLTPALAGGYLMVTLLIGRRRRRREVDAGPSDPRLFMPSPLGVAVNVSHPRVPYVVIGLGVLIVASVTAAIVLG